MIATAQPLVNNNATLVTEIAITPANQTGNLSSK